MSLQGSNLHRFGLQTVFPSKDDIFSKKQSTDNLSGVSANSTRSALLQITGLEPAREIESSHQSLKRVKLLAVLLYVPAGVEPASIYLSISLSP